MRVQPLGISSFMLVGPAKLTLVQHMLEASRRKANIHTYISDQQELMLDSLGIIAPAACWQRGGGGQMSGNHQAIKSSGLYNNQPWIGRNNQASDLHESMKQMESS